MSDSIETSAFAETSQFPRSTPGEGMLGVDLAHFLLSL